MLSQSIPYIWDAFVSGHINQVFASPCLVLAPTPGIPLAPDFHYTW